MDGRFFRFEPAFVDQPLDKRVIGRDLFELSVLEPISARVADMRQIQCFSAEQQSCDGCAHASQMGIGGDQLGQQRVGGLDFVGELGSRIPFITGAVKVDEVQNSRGGGYIAARVSTHAIRHHGKIPPGIRGVVVF